MSAGCVQADLRIARPGFALALALDVGAREVCALFGPSGSGKSTALRILAGLEPQAQGRVEVAGVVWQDSARGVFLPPHRRAVGLVFQDARLFPHLSALANIEYGLKRLAPAQRRILPADVTGLLGIDHLLKRRPAGLSGGERQRVAIARALCTSPALLLLDEPLSALDEARKAELLPYLEALKQRMDLPMLYVSHAMHEVARLADRLVLIADGRTVAAGPVGEISARIDLPLSQAEDAAVVLPAVVEALEPEYAIARLRFDGGVLWTTQQGLQVGQPLRAQVAARDVSLALQPPVGSSILNTLPGVIAQRQDDARGRSLFQVRVGAALLLARTTRKSAAELGLMPGVAVYVQVKGVAVLR